jgi:hypothetical protein
MQDGSPLDHAKEYTYTSKRDSFFVLPDGIDPYLPTMDLKNYTLCETFIEYINSGAPVTGKIDNRTASVH